MAGILSAGLVAARPGRVVEVGVDIARPGAASRRGVIPCAGTAPDLLTEVVCATAGMRSRNT
ncbi:hypothetical protein [Streptomyces griseus]|uniref:hypothetical protein n=1 Tax=Streptomyces griseus TaxID=1911 RepID=UPI0005652972|nr:hypothetical protein [Streptomyces griseus]